MVFGFNTDVRVGKAIYHVQTEDRGPGNPVVDTTIYTQGRVLHKRATSYKEYLNSPEFCEAGLRQRLEEQHRAIIDELRSGKLQFGAPGAAPPVTESQAAGISVTLLNPASWLAAGTASLKIQVKQQKTGMPVSDAKVEVAMEGTTKPLSFHAKTDAAGVAELSFPMPRLGPGGAELVIRASASSGLDESRYSLKPKARPSPRQ
jgi:hypothetical protein